MVVADITPVPPPCGMDTPAVTSPAALKCVSFMVRPSRVTLTEFRSKPLIVANCGPIRPVPDEVLSRRPGRVFRRLSTLFPTFGRLLTRSWFRTSPTVAEFCEIADSGSETTSTSVCAVLNFN